jgi:hypothetical protein
MCPQIHVCARCMTLTDGSCCGVAFGARLMTAFESQSAMHSACLNPVASIDDRTPLAKAKAFEA